MRLNVGYGQPNAKTILENKVKYSSVGFVQDTVVKQQAHSRIRMVRRIAWLAISICRREGGKGDGGKRTE